MLNFSDDIKVFVATEPVDMRKAIDGLSMLVVETLQMQPQSEHVFVFYNRDRRKLKLLYWDKNGFVMYYKRLQKGKFKFLMDINETQYEISAQQRSWLLAGLDFHVMSLFPKMNFSNYY